MTYARELSEIAAALTVDGSKNVGIGTGSPDQKLVVSGNIQSGTTGNNGTMYFGGPNVSLRSAYAANVLGIYTNNTERMRIDSSGNVGIGTGSPNKQLAIGSSGTSTLGFTWTGDNLAKAGIEANHTTGEVRYAAFTNYFPTFYSNNTERMRIDASGNVGIGTSNPTAKLQVSGGRTWLIASNETYSLALQYATGLGQVYIGATNSTSPDMVFSNVGGAEKMRITNAGDVGIGTSSPAARLHIDQNTAGDCTLKINNSYSGAAYASNIQLNAANATGANYNQIQSYAGGTALWSISGGGSAGTIAFNTGSSLTERMRISSSGALGFNGANYGSSGQVLTSQGSGATPVWTTPSTSSGTVTSVATGNGLQGGTITTSGTLSIACPTFNTVGSYAMGTSDTGAGDINPGSNISGGSVLCRSSGGNPFSTLSGTWRVMGGFIVPGYYYPVLLCRVS